MSDPILTLPQATAVAGDRSLFPDLRPLAYLNHAAIAPPSAPVREAMRRAMDRYAQDGVGAVTEWINQRERLRGLAAGMLGVAPQDLALTPGTTWGLLAVALGIDWQAGQRILCFDGEFPTNITPWQRAAVEHDLELVLLPLEGFGDGSGRGLARLEEELKRGARLVAVSAVQFSSGLAMPIAEMAELAHRYGAEICVDAMQAVGSMPLDLSALGVDYAATGSHKWCMGLEGSGMLYIQPDRTLKHAVAGWLSHEQGFDFLTLGAGHMRYDRPFLPGALGFEVGAPQALNFVALEMGLTLTLSVGLSQVLSHANRYNDALEEGLLARGFTSLRARDPAARSCILGVLAPEGVDVVALHAGLGQRGVSGSLPDGVLRFSPHWPNRLGEVPGVLDVVDEVLAGL